jgi:hypothetical protein
MSLRSTYFRISREARNSKVDQLLALQLEAAENVDRNAGFLQKQKHDLPPVRPSFCHACLAPYTPCRICRNKLRVDCFDLMMLIRYCLSAALEPTVSFPAAMRRRQLSSRRIPPQVVPPMGNPVAGFLEAEKENDGPQVRPLFATCCTTASCIGPFAQPASRRAKPPAHHQFRVR